MATICKVEKAFRVPSTSDGEPTRYPRRLVWAVLGDDGKTLFETDNDSDASFSRCLEYRTQHGLQVTRCLSCED